MEFHVEQLQMWQLPDDCDCIPSDPSRVEFHFADLVHVAIDHDASAAPLGKNCLFTMQTQPAAADGQVNVHVYKVLPDCRPMPNSTVLIGSGELEVQRAFAKLYAQIAEIEAQALAEVPDPEKDFPVSEVTKAWYPLTAIVMVEAPLGEGEEEEEEATAEQVKYKPPPVPPRPPPPPPKALNPTRPGGQLEVQATGGGAFSDVDGEGEGEGEEWPTGPPMVEQVVNVGMVCVRLRVTCFGTTIVLPSVQPPRPKRLKRAQQQTDALPECCEALVTPVCGRAAKQTPGQCNTNPSEYGVGSGVCLLACVRCNCE